jgi:hypothetical protein
MFPPSLCGRPEDQVNGVHRRIANVWQHNRLQGIKPSEKSFIVLPNCAPAPTHRSCAIWLARAQRRRFGSQRQFGIAVGGVQADVTEPSADHVDLDPRFQQMDGSGMPKEVRGDTAWFSTCGIPIGGVSSDDFVDAKARERNVAARAEHGFGRSHRRSAFCEQLHKVFDRLVPQRAYAPFISFAMQMHFGWGFKLEMLDPKIRRLLHARTGVVEKEQ